MGAKKKFQNNFHENNGVKNVLVNNYCHKMFGVKILRKKFGLNFGVKCGLNFGVKFGLNFGVKFVLNFGVKFGLNFGVKCGLNFGVN